jgi:hypothetical protein
MFARCATSFGLLPLTYEGRYKSKAAITFLRKYNRNKNEIYVDNSHMFCNYSIIFLQGLCYF